MIRKYVKIKDFTVKPVSKIKYLVSNGLEAIQFKELSPKRPQRLDIALV